MITAEHYGYTRLNEGVIHRRRLSLNQNRLEIIDHLLGNGIHDIEWRLHFAPQCKIKLNENSCIIKWHSGFLNINLDKQIQWSLLNGEMNGGWYSSAFNLKQPTNTLVGFGKIKGSITLNNSLDLLERNFSIRNYPTTGTINSS